ncbi:hypothetical protein [Aliivibrio sifiae]|uniref:hypothetical protein n=1 Tax=Aliivibrio sifiae TaxID=566293 RepID=UPI003D12C8DA
MMKRKLTIATLVFTLQGCQMMKDFINQSYDDLGTATACMDYAIQEDNMGSYQYWKDKMNTALYFLGDNYDPIVATSYYNKKMSSLNSKRCTYLED